MGENTIWFIVKANAIPAKELSILFISLLSPW